MIHAEENQIKECRFTALIFVCQCLSLSLSVCLSIRRSVCVSLSIVFGQWPRRERWPIVSSHISMLSVIRFSEASSNLYKKVRLFIRWTVHWSVCQSVHQYNYPWEPLTQKPFQPFLMTTIQRAFPFSSVLCSIHCSVIYSLAVMVIICYDCYAAALKIEC